MSVRRGLVDVDDSKLSRDLYIELTSAYDLLLNRYGITEYAALYEALTEREEMEIKEWKKFDGVSHGSVIYKGNRLLFRLKNGIELAPVNLGGEVVKWYTSPVLETERKKRYESRGLEYESGWEKLLGELVSFDERIRIDEGFLDTLEKERENGKTIHSWPKNGYSLLVKTSDGEVEEVGIKKEGKETVWKPIECLYKKRELLSLGPVEQEFI